MAKLTIKKSHSDLVAFIKRLIKSSDKIYGSSGRSYTAQRHYDEAKKLIERAERAE